MDDQNESERRTLFLDEFAGGSLIARKIGDPHHGKTDSDMATAYNACKGAPDTLPPGIVPELARILDDTRSNLELANMSMPENIASLIFDNIREVYDVLARYRGEKRDESQ